MLQLDEAIYAYQHEENQDDGAWPDGWSFRLYKRLAEALERIAVA